MCSRGTSWANGLHFYCFLRALTIPEGLVRKFVETVCHCSNWNFKVLLGGPLYLEHNRGRVEYDRGVLDGGASIRRWALDQKEGRWGLPHPLRGRFDVECDSGETTSLQGTPCDFGPTQPSPDSSGPWASCHLLKWGPRWEGQITAVVPSQGLANG